MLDLKDRLAAAKVAYTTPDNYKANFLLTGKYGSGKTTMAVTGPRPIEFDSFDPGGTKVIRTEVMKGGIVVNNFEDENPQKPSVWNAWVNLFEVRVSTNYFNSIGTYVIDSGTLFADSALNVESRGGKPSLPNYQMQQIMLRNAFLKITSLPCNVVVTIHLESVLSDEGAMSGHDIMLTGKLKNKVPLLFDEIYVLEAKAVAGKTEIKARTCPSYKYQARTRIGAKGVFNELEPPDIKALMKKADYIADDLNY